MTQKQQKTAPKSISQIIADAKQTERDRLLNPRQLGRADFLSSAVLTERMIEGIIGAASGSAATLTIARLALSEATKGRKTMMAQRNNTITIGVLCGVIGCLVGSIVEWSLLHR